MEPNLIFEPNPKVFYLEKCVKIKTKGFKNVKNTILTSNGKLNQKPKKIQNQNQMFLNHICLPSTKLG